MDDRWGEHTTALLREWAALWDKHAAVHQKLSQACVLGHVLLAGPAVVLPMLFPKLLPVILHLARTARTPESSPRPAPPESRDLEAP
jgi:hypothetical protein